MAAAKSQGLDDLFTLINAIAPIVSVAARGAHVSMCAYAWKHGPILFTGEALCRAMGIPHDRKILAQLWPPIKGYWRVRTDGCVVNDAIEALRPAPRAKDAIAVQEAIVKTAKTVLTFETVGPVRTWTLTEAHVAQWRDAYPNVDIITQCRRAQAWTLANSKKTARGMPAFLGRWLAKAADSAPLPRAGAFSRTGATIDAGIDSLRQRLTKLRDDDERETSRESGAGDPTPPGDRQTQLGPARKPGGA